MGARITEYGRVLRIIRMQQCELLKDMADKLKMTSSYLSAIENGKRSIPKNLTNKIVSLYNLDALDAKKLKEAEKVSMLSITVDLKEMSGEQQELAIAFAKKLGTLDNQMIKQMKQYLR